MPTCCSASRLLAVGALAAALVGGAYSIREMHTNPEYAADDLRGAVHFLAERWRPGDAVLINAGYAYTAFLYYHREPIAGRLRLVDYRSPDTSSQPLVLQTGIMGGDASLGWGDPSADFYATNSGGDGQRPGTRIERPSPAVGAAHLRHGGGCGRVRARLA